MMKSGRKDSAQRGGRRGWKVKLKRCELTDRQLHADNEAWAEVLKEARELREATWAELAEATGLTPLDAAIDTTSSNSNAVATLDSPDPTTEELRLKLNELIAALRR